MAEVLGLSADDYAALMAVNDRWPYAANEDGAAPCTARRREVLPCLTSYARTRLCAPRAALFKAHDAIRADMTDLLTAVTAMEQDESDRPVPAHVRESANFSPMAHACSKQPRRAGAPMRRHARTERTMSTAAASATRARLHGGAAHCCMRIVHGARC